MVSNVFRAVLGQIKRETDKALLFQPVKLSGEFVGDPVWFPISQLKVIHRTFDEIEGTFDVLMASEWILGQKGLLSISGVAGVDPVSAVNIVKPSNPPSYITSPKDMRHNRLPYKDDEGMLSDMDDDIPF